MKNEKNIRIDADEETLAALTDETIKKMAAATGRPEIFGRIMGDLKKLALARKKAACKVDSDAYTLASLSDATLESMAAASENPELLRRLFSDLKKAAKSEAGKSPNRHIYWSWSGEAQ